VNEVNPSDGLMDQIMKLLSRSRRVRKQCDETNAEIQELSEAIGQAPPGIPLPPIDGVPDSDNAGPSTD